MNSVGIVDLIGNGIRLEVADRVIAKVKIPSEYIAYTFAPILGTHHMITGDLLRNGFVVAIAERTMRENPNVLSPEHPDRKNGFVPNEYNRARVEETSRWALVTDLTQDGDVVKFTAIYADGTMRARSYHKDHKWAVLRTIEMSPTCYFCGEVHDQETEKKLPEEFLGSSRNTRSDFVDNLVSIFEDLRNSLTEENSDEDSEEHPDSEIHFDGRVPFETDDEFHERLRDQDESNGVYDPLETIMGPVLDRGSYSRLSMESSRALNKFLRTHLR